MKKDSWYDSEPSSLESPAVRRSIARRSGLPTRRRFLQNTFMAGAVSTVIVGRPSSAAAASGTSCASALPPPNVPSFELDETTINELQDAMKTGKVHGAQHRRELPHSHRANR